MMGSVTRWRSLGLCWLLLLAASPARAQVASLGKGWLLGSGGTITSTPDEVISGRNSIKGSNSNARIVSMLVSDTTVMRFEPGQTYTITFKYRVLSELTDGMDYGFVSSQPGGNRTTGLPGRTGSGTASKTLTVGPQTDLHVEFRMGGTGTVVIDDLQITNGSGQLVASENAEGPSLASGPLNFQLTDAAALLTDAGATVNTAVTKDLDADGYPETILTLTNANTRADLFPPIVIESSARMSLATSSFFPAGAPTVMNAPTVVFGDLNGDGLDDIVFAEAGLDRPPWTGARLGVALNTGGGKYRDVSSLIPDDQLEDRAYAVAVGDIDGDGRVEILLPDSSRNGSNTALLRWNGTGFDEQRNWIPNSLWNGSLLYINNWLNLADFDRDGHLDLVIAGDQHTPNLQVVFGGTGGFVNATFRSLLQLPDGRFGHTPPPSSGPIVQGAEVDPVLVADFNNDGLPDIFATERRKTTYAPGVYTDTDDIDYANIRANGGTVNAEEAFQVFLNKGARQFTDVSAASSTQTLVRGIYRSLIPIDINNDGYTDVVGVYVRDSYAGVHFYWGTTVFINDGTGAFQVVDGADVFFAATTTPSNGRRFSLGAFVPTVVTRGRTEGIVFESIGGCGIPGTCDAMGLNIYKVVANGALGTGPGFADSASLGVPGFNEFYYLRTHPDVAAAVERGEYKSGLEHYLVEGRAKGYALQAPNARVK
jgi:hypothetical protein